MISFSLIKTDIKKVELKLKSLFSFKKEINVDQRKKVNNINQIREQKNLNAPINNYFLLTDTKYADKVVKKISDDMGLLEPVSAQTTGDAELPKINEDNKYKEMLESYIAEQKENKLFFLDIERLLFFYEKRLSIDFTKEELVFLVQSSFKNDFPFWFWSFLYREKFGNVIPLFKEVFKTSDVKIRLKTTKAMGRFANVAENIVELGQTETNEIVLGGMVAELFKKNDELHAQRVIINAISRKLIPDLDYNNIKTLNAELGRNEKKFLLEVIDQGWPNEKIKAINILSVTANEDDLPALEKILENESYRETTFSVLHCIARIGKTNKNNLLEKELEHARWEEFFVQALETLVAVKNVDILPKLFEWYKSSSSFVWRFSSELHEWRLNSKIENAIISLMNDDFYETVIQDILSVPKGKDRDLYVWRQFNLLKKVTNKNIIELIKKETRLVEYSEWGDVVREVITNEAIEKKSNDNLIVLAKSKDYTTAMLSLRELWKNISITEALSYQEIINNLRKDLVERLLVFVKGDYPQEIKELASNDLDYFLGENSIYNRIHRKIKRNKNDDKKNQFSALLDDVGKFERIEDEFLSFILSKKDSANKSFLINCIGKPYSNIYEAISPTWPGLEKEEIKEPIQKMIKECNNPLLKLAGLSAERRMKLADDKDVRNRVMEILHTARKVLKQHGNKKKYNEWFPYHMVYYKAINVLLEIGNMDDLFYIEESINRETIMDRNFFRYSYFHGIESFRKLYEAFDITQKDKEKQNVVSALDTLDHEWTKKVLSVDN